MQTEVATSRERERNLTKKEAEKFIKYKDYNSNTAHVECKNKCVTSNNRKQPYWSLHTYFGNY
jgi:hypothetical protein